MNNVIAAFLEGKKKKQGNGQTDGRSLFLFGNLIARHEVDGLYITNAGWPTRTTNKWLNMLPDVSVYMHKKKPILNGNQWDGEMTRVNENTKPDAKHVGECFDESQEYVRLDGWRGYAKPKYSVTASLTPVDGTTALIQMPSEISRPRLLSSKPKVSLLK